MAKLMTALLMRIFTAHKVAPWHCARPVKCVFAHEKLWSVQIWRIKLLIVLSVLIVQQVAVCTQAFSFGVDLAHRPLLVHLALLFQVAFDVKLEFHGDAALLALRLPELQLFRLSFLTHMTHK